MPEKRLLELATGAAISLEDGDEGQQTLQAVLLVQLRTMFKEEQTDFLSTEKIIKRLNDDKELGQQARFKNDLDVCQSSLVNDPQPSVQV